jgi:hypothetical protein
MYLVSPCTYFYIVAEFKVGIPDGVKTSHFFGGIGEGERGGNDLAFHIHHPVALNGHGRPLSGGCFKPYISVGGNAGTMHDEAYTALVPVGVNILEGHYIYSSVFKIFQFIEHEPLIVFITATRKD